MSELTGWTKNWRKKWENPSLKGRINHLVVWDWLLGHAEWREIESERAQVRFAGEVIRLQLGQVTCGSVQIAEETGCAASTVRRVINDLKSEQLLEHQWDTRCSLITVKNWTLYQSNEQRVSSERAAGEQRVSTNKEAKKKEVKTYAVRPETNSLYEYIQQECDKYGLQNNVNVKGLDIQVERHLSLLRLRPEVQKCLVWMLDRKQKAVTTARLANWFEKAREIQKRDQLKQLEWKQEQESKKHGTLRP